jgi:glycosyltransferase involved in cell wall biosynthesis
VERLSAIIPCYNGEKHIGCAIESALSQSRAPDEVIVVDDGSADRSVARVAEFGTRVRLIRQPNRGAAAARNAGLAVASGSLIAFLDADDAWPVDSLALRLAEMERSGADIVFGRVRQCIGEVGPQAPQSGAELAGRLAGAMLVRRALFDTIGLLDETPGALSEIDWVARAGDAAVREAACEALVLYRRNHPANMMRVRAEPGRAYLDVLRGVVARRRAAAS